MQATGTPMIIHYTSIPGRTRTSFVHELRKPQQGKQGDLCESKTTV